MTKTEMIQMVQESRELTPSQRSDLLAMLKTGGRRSTFGRQPGYSWCRYTAQGIPADMQAAAKGAR